MPPEYQAGVVCLRCLMKLADNDLSVLDGVVMYYALDAYTLELSIRDIYEGPFYEERSND